ncbi:hypothetical protein SLE2022_031860 [Rubroshorea leprosula]
MSNMNRGQRSHARQSRPLPNEPNPLACTICNHVFASNQALLHHIEGHIIRNETASTVRRQHDMGLFSSNTNISSNSSNINHQNPLFSPEQINSLGLHPYPHQPPVDAPYPSSFMPQEPNHFPFIPFNGVLVPATSSSLSRHPLYARNGQPSVHPLAPHFGYQVQRRSQVQQEPPPNNHTRPLLSQLERKRDNEHDNGSSSSSALDVDLTLKL